MRQDRLGGPIREYTQVAWGDRISGTHRLAIINIEDKRARERAARRQQTGKRSDRTY